MLCVFAPPSSCAVRIVHAILVTMCRLWVCYIVRVRPSCNHRRRGRARALRETTNWVTYTHTHTPKFRLAGWLRSAMTGPQSAQCQTDLCRFKTCTRSYFRHCARAHTSTRIQRPCVCVLWTLTFNVHKTHTHILLASRQQASMFTRHWSVNTIIITIRFCLNARAAHYTAKCVWVGTG